MSLLITKFFFKKVWVWLKHHWKIALILIVLTVISVTTLLLVFRKNQKPKKNMIGKIRESYQEEIKVLNETRSKEIEEHGKAEALYEEVIIKIEKDYTESKIKLTREKKKEIKKLIKEGEENPDAITKEIAELAGYEYVPPQKQP